MAADDWQGDLLRQLGGEACQGAFGPPGSGGFSWGIPGIAPDPHLPVPAAPPPLLPKPIPAEPFPAEPFPAKPLPPKPRHPPAIAPPAAPAGLIDHALVQAQRRPRSGDSAAARARRSLRELTGASPARAVEAATEVARDLQQPITTGRQIVVTSIRGGAGKTTVAALLGRTFEHYRRDPVLTVEADAALGTLPIRLGAAAVRWTCADLAQVIDPSMQLTDITGCLARLPDGGWLLPGSRGNVGARLELPQYQSVMVALRRYFAITVVDCPTLPGELARTALAAAQGRVVVAPATVEGVASTRSVLDWMAGLRRAGMLARTVVVLVSSSPHTTIDAEAAADHLRLDGVAVLALPYDRHLAAGGVIQASLLARGTRETAARLAAEVLNRAVGSRR
ncbi:cellulose synthase operon protein YhjQ/BcsQ [Wenjunlia tyrosinilytica]|uniref:MinD-like ATPase involved in chromosome partitioning or flagellar assembly n=1 Tax=Wenjunlia tyrosinilytica TaxID=1544741 RepID=A0A917ZQY3_9ACTN|nr:cellulose synthase operon protein YhjQ/BcsQ [Wenjunlia tyrosinilytica]GGO89376.1 hypothetical protein GCM10012280_32370 [Wenjunlia tyrosinilytica]